VVVLDLALRRDAEAEELADGVVRVVVVLEVPHGVPVVLVGDALESAAPHALH